MMFFRWLSEPMNSLKTQLVASSSVAPGHETVPMFSPALLKQ